MPCRQRVTNTVQTSKHTRVEFKHSLHIKKKKIKYQNQFIQVIIKLSILQLNFEFKKGIKYENRVHFLKVKNVSPPTHTHTLKKHTQKPPQTLEVTEQFSFIISDDKETEVQT